jgi:hypothetical protein
MADVSVYVAVISAGAAIIGASLPQVSAIIQDSRKAKRDRLQADRDRQEQAADHRRRACVQLLRTALRLRVLVMNIQDYHGTELASLLAEIRDCAASAEVEAVSVALMVPPGHGKAAERLAEAAGRLALVAARNASLELGASVQPPDFSELDECVQRFKTMVTADGGGGPSLMPGQP